MIPFLSGAKSVFHWKIAPEVIEHSFTPVLGQHFSAKDFYREIQEILTAQKIQRIEISEFSLSEGGVLSDNRLYLRIKRERLVFDVCAAPMGVNFFFSYRFIELPVIVKLWEMAGACLGIGLLWWLCYRLTNPISAIFLFPAIIGIAVWGMRNAVGYGLQDLDAMLIKAPIIGPLYERYFRKDTYFRQDTRIMYRQLVAEVIKQTIEKYTAAKGAKLIREYSYAPLLDLYKANSVTLPVTEPAI